MRSFVMDPYPFPTTYPPYPVIGKDASLGSPKISSFEADSFDVDLPHPDPSASLGGDKDMNPDLSHAWRGLSPQES